MKIEFYVNPHQASMNVKVSYCKEEINQKHFYLNRDFVVNQCIVDGVEYDIYNYSQLTSLAYLNGYTVNKYLLPQYFSEIVIDYTGYLSGKTGCCPYVREKLSPEFSLIRWETFCYPIFFQDDAKTLMEFLRFNTEVEIVVTVKNEFLVVSDGDFIENSHENDIDKYVFKSNSLNISIAIAKYIIKELTMGKFYLLGDIDTNQLENTLVTAHDFMNIHFGVRNISSNVIYVAIPQGFGSFALPKIVFIEESTFKSAKSMNEIIH